MFPWLLMCFGFFFMASYPVVEASLMIAVPASTRGRAFGLFITFGGLLGNLSHWGIGHWVQRLGDAAWEVATYKPLFGGLAVLMGTSILALPLIRYLQVQLEKRQHPGLPVGIGLDPSFARVHTTGLQSDSKNTLGSTAVSTVDTTHERNASL
jgi:MFS family permease